VTAITLLEDHAETPALPEHCVAEAELRDVSGKKNPLIVLD
jgi:hypothetical protein